MPLSISVLYVTIVNLPKVFLMQIEPFRKKGGLSGPWSKSEESSFGGVDLKLGREILSLAFPSREMRQAFRWRPAFTKALTASATI